MGVARWGTSGRRPAVVAAMTRVVDLDQLGADERWHHAHLKREQERQAAEQRTAQLAEVMWQPALGWYLRQREEGK